LFEKFKLSEVVETLQKNGIDTVSSMLLLSKEDLFAMGFSAETVAKIETIITFAQEGTNLSHPASRFKKKRARIHFFFLLHSFCIFPTFFGFIRSKKQ